MTTYPACLCHVAFAILVASQSTQASAKAPSEKPPAPKQLRLPMTAEEAHASQRECAAALGIQQEVTNSLGMKVSLIPPGRFTLGPNGSQGTFSKHP
jgi:hypothetical protein